VTRSVGGHTIGVAIAIPSPYREVLDAARERFEPELGELPAHVTILAPVDVDADALPAVRRHLRGVADASAPFRLRLGGAGTFRPVSPVVFVRVDEGATECADLENRVRSGDMAVEARFPYHPHVTIAHDVADDDLDRAEAELAAFHADIDVTSIGLYENNDGQWDLLEEFELSGS
jgi:2'-5' RNA ligase